MKKIIIKIVILSLIVAIIVCTCVHINQKNKVVEMDEISFTGLDDDKLQEYVIENLYAKLNSKFSNDDFLIENISSTYVSKEYIEELSFNSKSNVYFGYSLDELAEQFNEKKYVFEVGENNETTVKEFEEYNDTYKKMLKNVAIGSGVILICTTVSIATGGTVSVIFAASAKTATEFSISSFVISGVISSAVEYYKTGDIQKSLEKGALDGSESFKWGAILGGISGGASETFAQLKVAKDIKTMNSSQLGARAESRAQLKYGGKDQVSYINGKEVAYAEFGATRPDLVREVNGKLEAIEVKNYNLESYWSRQGLYEELERQVTNRVTHLPQGSTQRIVLDVHGRNYSKKRINEVVEQIKEVCSGVYPNIPVDIMT